MLQAQTITLVIPCRNEASGLRKLLPRIPSFVDQIIVVDNGSTDNTVRIARYFEAKVLSENRRDRRGIGYGYAHRRGIKHATGDIIVTMDGDGTYPLEAIKPVIRHLLQHDLDLVSCHRYPLLKKSVVSPIRRLGVKILNAEVKYLVGRPIADILSGMWVGRRSTFKKLNLVEGGWNLSPEVKLKAIANPSVNFAEYHINHAYRCGGVSKQAIWVTGFDHLFYIARFALSYRLSQAHQFLQTLWSRFRFLPFARPEVAE